VGVSRRSGEVRAAARPVRRDPGPGVVVRRGSAEQRAAGGVHEGAGDPAGLVGGEEGHDVGDVLRLADPVEGRHPGHLLHDFGDVEDRVAVTRDARRDAVDRDAPRAQVLREVQGELLDGAFGHGVRDLVRVGETRRRC